MKTEVIYIIVLIVILILTGLVATNSFKKLNNPKIPNYSVFSKLQENMIDAEEESINIEGENIKLKESIYFYQQEMVGLIDEINQDPRVYRLVEEKKPEEVTYELSDRITEEQVLVSKTRVIIDVDDVEKWYVLDTNSMLPVIDEGSTLLTTAPDITNNIFIGDIILFDNGTDIIVHRIVNITNDEQGLYYTTKGDNNCVVDPWKVRFQDIEAIIIGIIY